MPTASSAQSKKSRSKIIPERSIRCLVLFTFRRTNSIIKLVPKSKIPAITKSITDQLTSFVNCIATSGISNSSNTMESRRRMVFGFGSILIASIGTFYFRLKIKILSNVNLLKIRNCKKPTFSVLRYLLISLIINVNPSIIKRIPAFLNREKYKPCFFSFFSML